MLQNEVEVLLEGVAPLGVVGRRERGLGVYVGSVDTIQVVSNVHRCAIVTEVL